jgi:hypothetical protein
VAYTPLRFVRRLTCIGVYLGVFVCVFVCVCVDVVCECARE